MESEKLLKVELLTPQILIFEGEVVSVVVPGSKSPFQILYNHAPIISNLDPGVIEIKSEGDNNYYFAISGGFVVASQNVVSLLVDSVTSRNEVEVENVKRELQELQKALPKEDDSFQREKIQHKIMVLQSQLRLVELDK